MGDMKDITQPAPNVRREERAVRWHSPVEQGTPFDTNDANEPFHGIPQLSVETPQIQAFPRSRSCTTHRRVGPSKHSKT
jgi:hypothetical protein